MIRGGRRLARLIFRTYDKLSNLKPVALHNSPAHARGVCVPKTLSDDVLTVRLKPKITILTGCCTEALSDLGADVRP